MATFPSLEPTRRSYKLGDFASTNSSAWGTSPIRFLHAAQSNQLTLTLAFEYLTDSEAASIRTHYAAQDGGHQSFTLPDVIWAGHSSVTDVAPTGTLWRYDGAPTEEHLSAGLVNMTVALKGQVSAAS